MKQSEFWKNFHLGTEIDIAGSFIYNGLRRLHQIETLYNQSEVFEILYNLAVGVECLLKVRRREADPIISASMLRCRQG